MTDSTAQTPPRGLSVQIAARLNSASQTLATLIYAIRHTGAENVDEFLSSRLDDDELFAAAAHFAETVGMLVGDTDPGCAE
jgi:hypothetical protein